ncbi:hypothetical protein C0214_17085 [Methylobacterium sp. DM1]|nr:hypothetical protein C0214_17055 [Methylobacterium sp. DM1]AWI89824.1 hypothetical protein C0214_17085 [Methylobacterium sp. DM1]
MSDDRTFAWSSVAVEATASGLDPAIASVACLGPPRRPIIIETDTRPQTRTSEFRVHLFVLAFLFAG